MLSVDVILRAKLALIVFFAGFSRLDVFSVCVYFYSLKKVNGSEKPSEKSYIRILSKFKISVEEACETVDRGKSRQSHTHRSYPRKQRKYRKNASGDRSCHTPKFQSPQGDRNGARLRSKLKLDQNQRKISSRAQHQWMCKLSIAVAVLIFPLLPSTRRTQQHLVRMLISRVDTFESDLSISHTGTVSYAASCLRFCFLWISNRGR